MNRKQHGFTLIEIIVSLILVGIITVFAGMGLVQTVESYIFSRDTVTLTEKAQLAMTRVALELNYLESISSADSNLLQYTSAFEDGIQEYQLVHSNNTVMLKNGQVDHLLIDGLGTYASTQKFLSYKKDDESVWSAGESINDLAFIEINLILERPGGSEVEYNSLIDVRNNKRANAVLPNI
jgi:prepilin-type N-terminal cleavage/methylation domain-containing protein